MPETARNHYDRLASSYDENWTYSTDFIDWMSGCILARLEVSPGDRVVDLGAGTGLFSMALAERAGKVVCVDPSPKMLDQISLPSNVFTPVKATAEEVASGAVKLPYDKVDALLIKEAIHHVGNPDAVLRQLAALLSPGGRVLVVMLPTMISYPLFRRALEVFRQHQPDPENIAAALRAAGLTVDLSYESYRLAFAKERYLAMVRDRYMSLLSEFDDAEIDEGIREIQREHPEAVLEFEDRFAFALGRRP